MVVLYSVVTIPLMNERVISVTVKLTVRLSAQWCRIHFLNHPDTVAVLEGPM
jgi:hypothetical protein